jgi:hypothetical protein
MSKVKTMGASGREFTLETPQGKGVRGKYFAKVSKGSNVVKLDPEIAKVFTNADAVNAALASVIEISKLTNLPQRVTKRRVV